MAAPNPVTDFDSEQIIEGSPLVTYTFDHDGANLYWFEFLKRPTGTTDPWKTVAMLVASDFLVSGTSYEIDLVTYPDDVYKVRAVSATGEVST